MVQEVDGGGVRYRTPMVLILNLNAALNQKGCLSFGKGRYRDRYMVPRYMALPICHFAIFYIALEGFTYRLVMISISTQITPTNLDPKSTHSQIRLGVGKLQTGVTICKQNSKPPSQGYHILIVWITLTITKWTIY